MQNVLLSSLIDHVRFIPLASEPPEAIINDRFGIKVIISENYIYVVQTEPINMVHVFSYPNGKFIHRHHRISRGPGEYTYIGDVDVYHDTLYILSLNSIFAYTFDGKYIDEYNIGMRANNFRVIDQNIFLLIGLILSSEVSLAAPMTLSHTTLKNHISTIYSLQSVRLCCIWLRTDFQKDILFLP